MVSVLLSITELRPVRNDLIFDIAWCNLKTTNKSVKFKILSLLVFLFTLACERIFIKMHSIESRCYRPGKYSVCRHVPASLSPDILQAGAETGLVYARRQTLRLQREPAADSRLHQHHQLRRQRALLKSRWRKGRRTTADPTQQNCPIIIPVM